MRITSRRLRQIIKEGLEGAKLSEYDAREDAPEPPLTLADTLGALNNIKQDINERFPGGRVIEFETTMFNPPGGEQRDASAERASHAKTLAVIRRIQIQIELVMRRLSVQTERE